MATEFGMLIPTSQISAVNNRINEGLTAAVTSFGSDSGSKIALFLNRGRSNCLGWRMAINRWKIKLSSPLPPRNSRSGSCSFPFCNWSFSACVKVGTDLRSALNSKVDIILDRPFSVSSRPTISPTRCKKSVAALYLTDSSLNVCIGCFLPVVTSLRVDIIAIRATLDVKPAATRFLTVARVTSVMTNIKS